MMAAFNEEIIAEARRWIGTPFHHQASACGVGTDCLGLIRGIWRALYGDEPEIPPPYAPDWAEATARETLLGAARRNLIEVSPMDAEPGDVLLFRLRRTGPARHCGVMSAPDHMIHAWSGRAVTEVPFDTPWRHRLSHAFRFPRIEDSAPPTFRT